MQEIAAGTRSLDNDYKPLLGKVSSLVQALGEPVSGKAGPNYHFYDSEQAMFLYLTELRSMTPYFENNHNLTADLQRGKCLGIFLNVVSEYDTCLMCSLFYKLHAISRSLTKNIKTCFNKDNSGKSAEAPIFFFITSNTRGRGEFYSDPDFVKVDYYLDSYFNGNTATKAMHKQKRAT